MPRIKTFKVTADDKESAKIEAQNKIANWQQSLKGQNCRVCQSILNSI
jgi:hypothetical protein